MNISVSPKKKKNPKIYELLPLFSTNKEREKKMIRDKVGIESAEINKVRELKCNIELKEKQMMFAIAMSLSH